MRLTRFGLIKHYACWMMGLMFTCYATACMATTSYSVKKCAAAPKSLAGSTLVMQIEKLTSSTPELYPAKGVIAQNYIDNKNAKAEHVGAKQASSYELQYKYTRKGKNKAIEHAIDSASGKQYVTEYTFTQEGSGRWRRTLVHDNTQFEGHFSLSTDTAPVLAPTSLVNLTVGLSVISAHSDALPAGTYPTPGTVILQSYDADNYLGRGFGPGTVDHEGVYVTTQVSPNVLVEETVQTIPSLNYTAPYTMVYTFDTPYSGTWYQSFADGLIIFSGNFTTFATQ